MKNTVVRRCKARAWGGAGSACLVAISLLIAACGSNPDRDRPVNPFAAAKSGGDTRGELTDQELHLQADELYRRAHDAVVAQDWSVALPRFDKLIAQYPFSDYATQAEAEKIYIAYKQGNSDEATAACDRFLRAHPRSAQAEYVQYLRGLTNAGRDEGFFDILGWGGTARRDVSSSLRGFEDLALLVQRYPNSKYVSDARKRMIYLRNRVAQHDLSVARYYERRGAYIAAARRAQSVIAEYPGSPATAEALVLLENTYRSAGLTQEADDAATLIEHNKLGATKPVAAAAVQPTVAENDSLAVPAAMIAADNTVSGSGTAAGVDGASR